MRIKRFGWVRDIPDQRDLRYKPPPRLARALPPRVDLTAGFLGVYNQGELGSCLASGYPFVFGFSVYESFESPRVAATGVVNLPRIGERVLGGHAVVAVGYDQKTSRFTVRNSWGARWGKDGYFTMPFQYLTNAF